MASIFIAHQAYTALVASHLNYFISNWPFLLFGPTTTTTTQTSSGNIFLDGFSSGTLTPDPGPSPLATGTLNRLKISDNSNPIPADRLLFDYKFFSNPVAVPSLFNGTLTVSGLLGGNDTFSGSPFGDTAVRGHGGGDILNGKAGNDILHGDGGLDVLIGGLGRDTLFGDAGRDRFDFNNPNESRPGGTLRDAINDHNRALGEKIDVATIDANTTLPGNQAFVWIGNQPFANHPGTGEIRQAPGLVIQFNVDPDNAPDMEIKINHLGGNDDFRL